MSGSLRSTGLAGVAHACKYLATSPTYSSGTALAMSRKSVIVLAAPAKDFQPVNMRRTCNLVLNA
ncbi:hypothetical protein GGP41_006599 [Bipolaris sorokiniana]|uniref:Uncharacterized protein n=1 Tax=Cochliobolus sativus TaxID=45130 RepID=A0A8H6DZJ4_COCSA|nr:hypothetical protein GGP41_006599 [Bipolaris sorokiniana]